MIHSSSLSPASSRSPHLTSSSPGRPLKRRILPHAPALPKTSANAADRYITTPDLESTPDSESAKGHPELLGNRQLLSVPSTTTTRQKYSMFRPRHMIPILLFLAAGVPFIVHLKLGAEMHQQTQQKIQLDEPKSLKRNSTSKRRSAHGLQQHDIEAEDTSLPRKRDSHFLRQHPSNQKSLMKFHSLSERTTNISTLNLVMPSLTNSIKVDGITVSLMTGIAGNDVEIWGSNIPESSDDVKELNHQDENDSNADNTVSQDDTRLLNSETAVWEPDQECVPMEEWQTTFKPTCNSLHEMDMPFLLNKEAYSLVSNKGFWRNAWNVDMKIAENGMSPVSNIVIKSLKYYHEPNDETFELNRVDGVSMEQLTHSRYITDIYGYCGTTSLQEFAGAGNLAKFLPKLKPVEKLGMAAWVSAGVADIHEVGKKISGNNAAGMNSTITASLIHNDINMDNILLGNRDGIRVPLINDFNIAIFRKKDAQTGEPCKFRGRFNNPQWMAPEQMFTKDREDGLSIGLLNEKIDVYALGNILYKIAVGKSPWKYNFNKAKKILEEHKEKITRTKLKGGKPKVPDEVKNSKDPSIQAVLTAMDRCYRNDPDVRPSAREISDYLNKKFLTIGRKKNK